MTEVILAVKDLRKSFGGHNAVNGISYEIVRGEIFGLLGPNGAGKTTTIAMMTGLFKPTSGNVSFTMNGQRWNSSDVKPRLGLVPQEMALYPTLSAWDNLLFFGRIYGLRGRKLRERVKIVLEMVGLADRAKEPIDSYSGGMKRRINIAAGLLHEPDVLFLDEPTVGVDPQSRNAIFENIQTLNSTGLTIIYTTHYMEEAQRLCDRIAIIDRGRVIALDTPGNLINSLGGGLIRLGLHNGLGKTVAHNGRAHPEVRDITIMDDCLIVETHNPQKALIGMLDIINQMDVRVTSLEVMEPNLEAVFLQLTGKSLRDN
ncbi:MAG: ABC transporter ATP-binding protein [Anaerolineales bacterium]|nr:ABC transporter ATP-binding protein [Anaerolineales bacterium]